jgi:hypothetical protein
MERYLFSVILINTYQRNTIQLPHSLTTITSRTSCHYFTPKPTLARLNASQNATSLHESVYTDHRGIKMRNLCVTRHTFTNVQFLAIGL